MDWLSIYNSDFFRFIALPLLIFVSRIVDMTLDTLRIIYISRGIKLLAPIIGFFQTLLWLIVISQIFSNLKNPLCYIAYSGGFAIGNLVGMMLEEKMALGTVVIRVITQKDATQLINMLKADNFGLTYVDAQGAKGPVKVIFTITKRKEVAQVLDRIKQFSPLAFYTIEDLRSVRKGGFAPLLTGTKHSSPSINV